MFCSCSRHKLRTSYNMNNKITMLSAHRCSHSRKVFLRWFTRYIDGLVTPRTSNARIIHLTQSKHNSSFTLIRWCDSSTTHCRWINFSRFISIKAKLMTKVNFHLLPGKWNLFYKFRIVSCADCRRTKSENEDCIMKRNWAYSFDSHRLRTWSRKRNWKERRESVFGSSLNLHVGWRSDALRCAHANTIYMLH